MQILYIYFASYEYFKNQQINFGGRLRFSYDREKQELNVVPNQSFIKDFFCIDPPTGHSLAVIKNITAIVGDNGSGKSMLLHAIKRNFIEGVNGIRETLLIALEHSDGSVVVHHSKTLPISRGNYRSENVSLEPLVIKKDPIRKKGMPAFDVETYPTIRKLEECSFIHFSNVFDGTTEFEFTGLHEISTNFLIRNDLLRSHQQKLINMETNQREVETHLYEEMERQVKFINEFAYRDVISFDLPTQLVVSQKRDISNFDFVLDRFEKQNLADDSILKAIEMLVQIANRSIEKENNWGVRAQYSFMTLALINFLLESPEARHYPSDIVKNLLEDKIDDVDVDIKSAILEIISYFLHDSNRISPGAYPWNQWEALEKLIGILPDIIDPEKVSSEKGTAFVIDLGQYNEQFRDFYKLYQQTFLFRPYLNFTFAGLSSGERALLSMYARFHWLTRTHPLQKDPRLHKNIILLIDEGDLYMHPDWQRNFIRNLVSFLPKVYKKELGADGTLQIIFATNSPIPVSDLPNANIIFLEKGDQKAIIKDSLDDRKPTFAANIHSLLADSFFMKNGTIGAFAFEKINQVITMLEGTQDEIRENNELIEKMILMIGETVIRTKLLSMRNERLQLSYYDINRRLEQLEKERTREPVREHRIVPITRKKTSTRPEPAIKPIKETKKIKTSIKRKPKKK